MSSPFASASCFILMAALRPAGPPPTISTSTSSTTRSSSCISSAVSSSRRAVPAWKKRRHGAGENLARRMPLQAPDKIERLDANVKEWLTRLRAETRGTRATCLASMMSRKSAVDRLRVGTPAGWEGAHYKFSSNQKYIFDHRGGERLSVHAASFSIAYGQNKNVTSITEKRSRAYNRAS